MMFGSIYMGFELRMLYSSSMQAHRASLLLGRDNFVIYAMFFYLRCVELILVRDDIYFEARESRLITASFDKP